MLRTMTKLNNKKKQKIRKNRNPVLCVACVWLFQEKLDLSCNLFFQFFFRLAMSFVSSFLFNSFVSFTDRILCFFSSLNQNFFEKIKTKEYCTLWSLIYTMDQTDKEFFFIFFDFSLHSNCNYS